MLGFKLLLAFLLPSALIAAGSGLRELTYTCQANQGGCGSGEQCCHGLTCQWTTGGHRRCLKPVPPPGKCGTMLSWCGQGEQFGGGLCCDGLSCQDTYGSQRICLPHHSVPSTHYCLGTSGGCGSGETCCPGLECQWSPGSHRTCLPPCKTEHNSCRNDAECCSGLECEHGRCRNKPTGRNCHHPFFGDIAHGSCPKFHVRGQCLILCCTDGRTTTSYSPLALDIDGSGLVERVKMGHVKFDINGNGELEDLHEWFSPTEGILVNTNVTGKVLSGKHLFGDEGGKYENGFDKLAALDVNGDGVVSGSELGGLKLWIDTNLNAYLDESDKMKDLSEFGIVSLSLQHEKMVGHANLEDGRTMRMEDLWFEGEDITVE